MKNVGVKCKNILCSMVILSFITTSFLTTNTAQASSTSQSFNTSTGALNVDYAGYLSKHDLVFNSPITDPKKGIMVGNGRVGAQVWNSNGLTMQVTGVDTSPQTSFSSGLVNLYANPGMDTGYSSIQQRLSLYDGLMTTQYDSDRKVTIMGSPNSEVLGIHVDDSRTGVSSVALDLSIWDVSNLSTSMGNGIDVPDINTWKTVTTFVDPTVVGFSRGQTDANKFGYTMAATVEGASFTTQSVNGNKVRLNITPSSSYTIWITSASRYNAPNNDSVTYAKNLLNSVKSTGYTTTLENYKNWWHHFWSQSFVQYSNASGDADYMENVYDLSNYVIASGAYGSFPFHFINGVYSGMNDDDAGHWSFAYWYWNQRDVYNSFLASNHPDVMNGFNNEYSRNLNALKSHTMARFGIDGLWAPETMRWDGSANNNNSDYTNNIMSSAEEAAQNMYTQYKYTNDLSYLRNTAYPFMKEVAKFYTAKLSYDNGTGKYYMASSNSHETYWNVKNAITDLAAVRALFPRAIEASTKLGLDSDLRAQWQNVLNNLAAYPTDGTQYLPNDLPAAPAHNNENVTSELLWPYGVTGIGAEDYSKALASFNNRPFPYGNVWSPDAIQAARLGLGDEAYNGMKKMLQFYQNYPNLRTTNTNGEFEYLGVHLSAMNESLLQSYNDKIRVFPALPSDTAFVSKFTLLAQGGFLVSSEKEANEIKYVGVKSLYGNSATVVNPWGTQQVQVRRASDNAIILTTSSPEFNFTTTANTVYVIERTTKPLSTYTYQQLTGTANQTVKSLSGTNSKLGSDQTGGYASVTTFYGDTSYGGKAVTLNPGSYTTAQLAAAGIPDNSASSLRVPLGYTIQVFDQDNFGGTEWTFTADNSDFPSVGCNDRMSSVKIIASGGKYEAENATLSGGAAIATDHTGYSGTGFVDGYFNVTGASTKFTVNVAAAGNKTVTLRYSAAGGNSTNVGLYVNGTKIKNMTFIGTADWNTWADETETINLNSGSNTIEYRAESSSGSCINLDNLTVQ